MFGCRGCDFDVCLKCFKNPPPEAPLRVPDLKPDLKPDLEPSAGEETAEKVCSFPAGPMGIDINQKRGRVVVTGVSGVALSLGVAKGDVLVRVGSVGLDSALAGVPDEARCALVKGLIVKQPRPLELAFLTRDQDEALAAAAERELLSQKPVTFESSLGLAFPDEPEGEFNWLAPNGSFDLGGRSETRRSRGFDRKERRRAATTVS